MLDARPFLTLKTAAGSCKCLRPELKPLALGISGDSNGIAADQTTHTIDVPVALTNPPADLVDNVVVWVDVEKGKWAPFRVLRNGMDKGAGIWTLYVRADDAPTPLPGTPEQPAPADDGGYWGTP